MHYAFKGRRPLQRYNMYNDKDQNVDSLCDAIYKITRYTYSDWAIYGHQQSIEKYIAIHQEF